MVKRWYLQCISCKEWEACRNISYCILTHNSAENRHDHCHHFHQRGNGNREFVTCSRSHTKHGAELLGTELSPTFLVLQPQDDLSRWFVLGTCPRYFALCGVICSASLHRIVTSLSLLNTSKEYQCYYQMGVKVSENVHLQMCSKSVAPQIHLPLCGMECVLLLLCNTCFIDNVCSLQAFGILQCRKVLAKIWIFLFLKCTVCMMREGKKEHNSDCSVLPWALLVYYSCSDQGQRNHSVEQNFYNI